MAHDGTIAFYQYDAKGRQTERASFGVAYQSATTRPALGLATSVTSTQWHATWRLPLQVAEANQLTTYGYDAKGNLASQGVTATTDNTGATKFAAIKTGSTYTTNWTYNASNLATTTVEKTNSTETGRWTTGYNTLGDITSITDVAHAVTARMTQYDAHGHMLAGATDMGVAIELSYSPRGFMTRKTINGQAIVFTPNVVGNLRQVKTPDGQTIDYVLDANQRLTDVKLNGVSITPQMLAQADDYPDTPLKAQIAKARQWLEMAIGSMMAEARAQVVIVPGKGSGQPAFDPSTDMLMAPMTPADKAARSLQEALARLCKCNPNGGYQQPTFTTVTWAHVFWGGHTTAMFADQSYFAFGTRAGQALVNEVLGKARAINDPGTVAPNGRRVFRVDMGRDVGMVRAKPPSAVPFVPTQ